MPEDVKSAIFGSEDAPIQAQHTVGSVVDPSDLKEREYKANHVAARFHKSPAYERLLWGPVGCGKTFALIWEIMLYAMRYPACLDGTKKLRFVVVRNTYQQLRDTTIQSFFEVFPEGVHCSYNKTEQAARIQVNDLIIEIQFRALDRADDVGKIKSVNATGYIFNELSEIDEEIYLFASTRCGRYPPRHLLGKQAHGCMFSDTNPTDEDHWVYRRFERDRTSDTIATFSYPGGLDPKAVNLQNLPKGYYTTQMKGRSPEWLRRYRDGLPGPLQPSGAVYTGWKENLHLIKSKESPFDPILPLHIGLDYGLSPTAVFLQRDGLSRWIVIDEFQVKSSVPDFALALNAHMDRMGYYNCRSIQCTDDPSGEYRQERNVVPCSDYVTAAVNRAFSVVNCFTNDMDTRHLVTSAALSRNVGGVPRLRVWAERCPWVRRAFGTGYVRTQMGRVDKNEYSHYMDALAYALIGAGEDRIALETNTAILNREFEFGHSKRRPGGGRTAGRYSW